MLNAETRRRRDVKKRRATYTTAALLFFQDVKFFASLPLAFKREPLAELSIHKTGKSHSNGVALCLSSFNPRKLAADRWIADCCRRRIVHADRVGVGIKIEVVLAGSADAFANLRICIQSIAGLLRR